MTWVAWRRHRALLATTLALLVAFVAAVAAIVALGIDRTPVADPFGLTNNYVTDYLGYLVLAGPVLIGALVGAPLLASDLERRTHVLVLSQSVGRTGWMGANLLVAGLPAVLTLTVAAALSGAVASPGPWYDNVAIAAQGLIPFARGTFALLAGALVGLLVRRVLPAVVLGGLLVLVVQVLVDMLRPLLLAPVLVTGRPPASGRPAGSWTLDGGYLGADGRLLPYGIGTGCTQDDAGCLSRAGIEGTWARVHPLAHRWPLHWIEVAIYAVLALAALTVIVVRLRRPLPAR